MQEKDTLCCENGFETDHRVEWSLMVCEFWLWRIPYYLYNCIFTKQMLSYLSHEVVFPELLFREGTVDFFGGQKDSDPKLKCHLWILRLKYAFQGSCRRTLKHQEHQKYARIFPKVGNQLPNISLSYSFGTDNLSSTIGFCNLGCFNQSNRWSD